jgi:prepilin signal peptidase PulO-like enzyme (type II secretory pathway)
LGALYWSIVSLVLGGCIGSFLNVVIYRWPRDLSLREPKRSFCPSCRTPIAWYDNIPVISYLILAGRCRHCKKGIALRYPLVELATAFVFLLTFDAFFIAQQRMGIGQSPEDWIILVAHWILWAGMIVLAVMDLEAYLVDIRITWFISAVGIIAHTLWTPVTSQHWIRPGLLQSTCSGALFIGLVISAFIFLWQNARSPVETAAEKEAPGELVPPYPAHKPSSWGWLGLVSALVLVAFYMIWLVFDVTRPAAQGQAGYAGLLQAAEILFKEPGASLRIIAGLILLFLALALLASHPQPEIDTEVLEEITAGAPSARRQALQELAFLLPAIILFAAALLALANWPGFRAGAQSTLYVSLYGSWWPVLGLATGLSGWIIGGAVGWMARIFFTLLFGKEALGMGDVHLLAAAGAVAGWPVAFLGFFLAAPLSLLALIVIHLRRQSRALPYGPWLALGFLLASVFQDHILLYLGVRHLFE